MNEFESDIEHLVVDGKYTYIEALVQYGIEHQLDNIALQVLIKSSKPILAKLSAEGRRTRMLKDGTGRRSSPASLDKALK